MLNELYVDDLINSTTDITDALQLSEDMIHILSEAGMNLHRWATNSPTLHEAWKRANMEFPGNIQCTIKNSCNNMGRCE
ncbi:integrase_H2C2 domain-containing protein [Trichonephila clavata]|uniref:Integrase_H2C2 domain-containing protein n=1 Tax=Trichonephila clavata TaxID=2740835 RepID=A0A8X6ILE4_TRICU|nr:integrase_H2C2 domain-containing protein [Trichonephila clavata]